MSAMHCTLLSAAAIVGSVFASSQASAQVSATKSDAAPMAKAYGSLELRHHNNTFYDESGSYTRQEPSMHARAQLGLQLYEGRFDFYTTLGTYKKPQTQQILQRKPELALDMYPIKLELLTLLVYNIIQFPVRNPDYQVDDERENLGDGTIYIFGTSPTVRFRSVMQVPRIDLKIGADGWTKLYSRKQYTGVYSVDENEDGHGAALTETSGEEIEDTAMHYKLQSFAGMAFNYSGFRMVDLELTTHYQSDFQPVYEKSEDNVEYHYGVSRFSFVKVRLNWDITPRVSFANDFYTYYDGLFDEKRSGDERRIRNVARITSKM